jgi:hypothetical protein
MRERRRARHVIDSGVGKRKIALPKEAASADNRSEQSTASGLLAGLCGRGGELLEILRGVGLELTGSGN